MTVSGFRGLGFRGLGMQACKGLAFGLNSLTGLRKPRPKAPRVFWTFGLEGLKEPKTLTFECKRAEP